MVEKNEVSTISLYCTVLREVLEFGIGRGNPGGAQQSPWVEEMELRVQEDQGG